jgi:SAM-dependent methyltransferase
MDDLSAHRSQLTYTKTRIVRLYAAEPSQLNPVEDLILKELLPEIKGKRLLDIGVGGGRTTGALLEISRNYTAIDSAAELVALTRKRFGLESVWCCDARDMRRFADSSFDFVLFSFNGIDYVSYQDRPRVISEVARVLCAGGLFMFSSHNRNFRYLGKMPWQDGRYNWKDGRYKLMLELIKDSLSALVLLPRHLRLKRHEIYESDYAIVNDNLHRYSLLTCYVTISAQTRDLVQAGFNRVRAYDREGKIVTTDDSSMWIDYVARKSPVTNDGT